MKLIICKDCGEEKIHGALGLCKTCYGRLKYHKKHPNAGYKGRWAFQYDNCIKCGTIKIKHVSRGLCGNCYSLKWQKEHPERVRGYKKRWKKENPNYNEEYYEKNKEMLSIKKKISRERNKEEINRKKRENYWIDKEKINKKNREWYRENRESVLEKTKKYRENNIETIKERDRKFYLANKEKIAEGNKKWRRKNKVKLKIYMKEYHQNNKERLRKQYEIYYEKNKEYIKKRNKIYYQKNKDKINKKKKKQRIEHPKKIRAKETISFHKQRLKRRGIVNAQGISETTQRIVIERDKVCVYNSPNCEIDKNLSFDHIKAIDNGGDNNPLGFVLACRKCNSSKGTKNVFKWCKEQDIPIPLIVLELLEKQKEQQCLMEGKQINEDHNITYGSRKIA